MGKLRALARTAVVQVISERSSSSTFSSRHLKIFRTSRFKTRENRHRRCRLATRPVASEASDSALLWKLRYELLKFALRPRSGSGRANISQRTKRKREFGNILAMSGVDNEEQIVLAGGEIDLLDIDAQFLCKRFCGLTALGSVLDLANSLFGPV